MAIKLQYMHYYPFGSKLMLRPIIFMLVMPLLNSATVTVICVHMHNYVHIYILELALQKTSVLACKFLEI